MPETDERPKYVTLDQVAALFKEPPEKISKLVRTSGLPTLGRGRFDLARVIHWREDYYRRQLVLARETRNDRDLVEIAHLLKKEPRWITKLAKDEGLPRSERGVYNLIKVIHWLIDRYERQVRDARIGGETESMARKRLWQAQANLKEIELAQQRKEVVNLEDVVRILQPMLKALREKIYGRSRKIAPQLQGATPTEIEAILLKYDTEALNELANIPKLFGSAGAALDGHDPSIVQRPSAAAKAHR